MPSDGSFQPGELIGGRYRLLRLIGVGGMGAVWRVHNEATDRDVAIKFMLPELAKTPTTLQRFFQEAKALGRVRHRSIVEVYDLGRIEQLEGAPAEPRAGTPYLVMELLDGEPLDAILRRLKKLPLRAALELAAAIADGLQAAHAAFIVHRDLKPANIFLHRERDGSIIPKILDFGVSKLLSPSPSRTTTSSGVVVGSPGYMSPEQAAGDVDIDARSDLWSLGVILYRCLAGREPFREANYNATMLAIVMNKPEPIESLVDVPSDVAAIVRQCLTKRRDERIGSVDLLLKSLRAALANVPPGDGLAALTVAVTMAPAETPLTPLSSDATEVDAPVFTSSTAVMAPRTIDDLPKTVELATPPSPRRKRAPMYIAAGAVAVAMMALALWPRAPSTTAAAVPSATASTPPLQTPLQTATSASLSSAAPMPSTPSISAATPTLLKKPLATKPPKTKTGGKQSEGVLDPGLP